MNNRHIVNIKESLLFLSICRSTLYEMYDNKELKYFIKNEASDYQIINIIVNDEIPIEKYNLKEEKKQWEIFRHTICESSKLFDRMGPIVEYRLSSCKVIYDHLNEVSGDQGKYIQGLYNNMKSAMKTIKSTAAKGTTAAADLASKTAESPLGKIAVGATAGAAASVIVFAAIKAYKDYIGKASQACNGKPDKVACMKQYKDRALQLRIAKIRSGMSTCNKAKNADACKRSLQKQLDKLQAKEEK